MDLTTGALLNQSGAIIVGNGMNIVSAGRIENAQGLLSAGGTLDIRETTPSAALQASAPEARTLSITNTGGTLIADQRLAVAAQSLSLDGDLLSQQDMTLSVQGDHTHAAGSRIVANRDLTIDIEDGGLINSGELLAGRNLGFTADSLDNTSTGEISAGDTTDIRVTQALNNRGLIDGQATRLQAQSVNNIGTGRIYGDALAIQADTLRNDTETVGTVRSDAVIAARERLDIGVQELINREGATILSLGSLAIGGELDTSHRASGMAQKLQNQSATIEALGQLSVAVRTLENTNTRFEAELVAGPTSQMLQVVHNGVSYDPQDLGMSFGPLNSYVDNAGFRLLLPSAEYPFSAFPANVSSWATSDTGVQISFGLGDLMSNAFGPRVASPFAVEYSRRRIRDCRDCEWKEVDTYTASHGIWARFGVTPYDPASGDAELKRAAQDQLDQKIAAYNLSVGSRTLRDWTVIDATAQEFTPIVKSSRPAQLLAGGDLNIHSTQEVLNDKSEIVAGGTLGITGAALRNVEADVLARTEVRGQSVYSYYIEDCDFCDPDRGHQFTPYEVDTTRTVGLAVSRVEQHTAPPASSLQIGAQATHQTGLTAAGAGAPVAGAPGSLNPQTPIVLPTSALFRAPASTTATYLIETDPRFADERQWRSSDYLLQAMSIDPATIQKRLGDGFYEQRLVREQIGAHRSRGAREGP
jgi:filamentous hemagglutinin